MSYRKKFNFYDKMNIERNTDRGSTLITVIVVIAFISILATIMLYLAGENYKTKASDLKTKESFYEAEEVVEFLRSQLITEVSKASAEGYTESCIYYVSQSDKSIRQSTYLNTFKDSMEDSWKDMWYENVGGTLTVNRAKGIATLFDLRNESGVLDPSLVSFNPEGTVCSFTKTINGRTLDVVIDSSFLYEGALVIPSSIIDSSTNRVNRYNFKEITVTVTDERDYSAIIKTAFEITPPEPNLDSIVSVVDGESHDPSKKSVSPEKYGILDIADCVQYDGWTKE
jgi:type II secretory pathway pseudopilin PulG